MSASSSSVSLAPQAASSGPDALDLAALSVPEISFWTAWDGATLLGFCALKALGKSGRRNGGVLGDHRAVSLASGRLTHAAIVAGPSSNILR